MNKSSPRHIAGYYWCDTCDDSASGPRCDHNHTTRFIENEPQSVSLESRRLIEEEMSPIYPRLTKERAKELFDRMRANIETNVGESLIIKIAP